jgi:plastocyanin
MSRRIAVLVILSLVLVVACGDDDAETTTVPTTTTALITIVGFDFGDPISVTVGQTVTVRNDDGTPHTWTSADRLFDSGTIDTGDSFTYSFATPGTYAFLCEIHTAMTGMITVSD